MLKLTKYIALSMVSISTLSLTGCVRALLPTSDAELVTKAVNQGYQAELDINYVDAYANLKQAYTTCIAYVSRMSNDMSYISVDSKLDRDSKQGLIYANSNYNTYLSKVILKESSENKTSLTLYLAKSKLLTENKNLSVAEERFVQEKLRALGQDEKCNKDKK